MVYTRKRQTTNAGSSLPVFVMCGQSNMEGDNADTAELSAEYLETVPNAVTYFKTNANPDAVPGTLECLKVYRNPIWRTSQKTSVGPEIGMSYDLQQSLPTKMFGIMKYSYGGSLLVDDGVTTTPNGLWDKLGNASRAGTPGLHYNVLINNFLIPAITVFKKAGVIPYLAGFVWCQGEADSQNLYCANNYQSKLIELIEGFKTAINPYASTSNMHVIISRIHNNFTAGTRPYLTTVRTALENVAANYGSKGHWINTDSYPVKSDFTHWTKQGQTQHGLDISAVLKTIIP